MWARGVGGHITTRTTGTTGNVNFLGPQSGSIPCTTHTQQDFSGVQTGADFARLNVSGWNLHTGGTMGYMGASIKDVTPAGNVALGGNPPPDFVDDLQAPFVGLYAAATKGGFFVDGQIRWDYYQNRITDANNGLFGQHVDSRGLALTADIGYNQALQNNWFIEPSAGVIWSRTQVDPINTAGTAALIPPSTLTVNDIHSTLGRLSLRAGTSFEAGTLILQPFATASVLHEFQGQVTANAMLNPGISAIDPTGAPVTSTVTTDGLGTYGQFALGVAGQIAKTGWLGYVRGDYRTGENIQGWSLNGGARYQFDPDPVAKAPMITKAPIYKARAAQTVYNWTGFYVGAYVGVDWGFTNWTFVGGNPTGVPRFAGFLGGGEIGYNYQVAKWVFGVEGDAGWTNAHGAHSCLNPFLFTCEIDVNWLSTATARVGYTYWDRLLVYVKGGAAVGQVVARVACNTACPAVSDSNTKLGWTVGWGTEFALTPNVSVKSETSYFNLGTDRYNLTGSPADIRREGYISTVGLHYNFGAAPTAIVAKN